jgi:NAD(P)-dependent dehydrogenase (short-subunit alcohol dehydrogenase family)
MVICARGVTHRESAILMARTGTTMDFGIKDKTALVLGGGGGLGRAISLALAKEGANLTFADIEPNAVTGTETALAEIVGRSIGLVWDLSDLSQIDPNVSKVVSEIGPVEILVNITGGPPPTPASGQDTTIWSKHFQAMVLFGHRDYGPRAARYASASLGSSRHQYLLRRGGADPKSRHFQCAAPVVGRMVQDFGARGRQRRYYRQHRRPRAHCDRPDQVP